jgi:hypothetical protein
MANYRSVGGDSSRVSLLDAALQCVVITKLGNELRASLQVPRELPRELHALVTRIAEMDESKDR